MDRDKLKKIFIEKAKNKHGSKYDYSNVDYINSSTKINIKCIKHNFIFQQAPRDHISGSGCKKCGIEERCKKRMISHTEFIKRANKVHKNYYDYSLVKYNSVKQKIIIICPEHGQFKQTVSDHLSNHGCAKCGINKSLKTKKQTQNNIDKSKKNVNNKRKTTEEFIEDAIKIHGDNYNYDQVIYTNCTTKVIIKCNRCNISFYQLPGSHISGKGCKECAIKKNSTKQKMTQDEFIKRANEIHNNKYDYSMAKYNGSNKKIIIICKEHGSWECTAGSHLANHGCRKCSTLENSKKAALTIDELILRATKLYGNKYIYKAVEFDNMHDKVLILCYKHGCFIKSVNKHLNGQECPKCNPSNFSKKAIEWLNSIVDSNNIYIQHAMNIGEFVLPGTKYKVDGYCAETNTIYEFFGDKWHGNPKFYKPTDLNPINKKTYGELYSKTLQKNKIICDMGYNLVIIWEHEWDNKK